MMSFVVIVFNLISGISFLCISVFVLLFGSLCEASSGVGTLLLAALECSYS